MFNIHYSPAIESDAGLLAHYRVAFLAELVGPQTTESTASLQKKLEAYFTSALADKSCICWLAKDGDTIAATGAMTIREQPGNFKNPTGITGYIMNMYTVPAYRRQGICSVLLHKLMETGAAMGICAFELHATKDGEPIYQKSGFEKHHEPTYRKYGL